ncbi:MAG: hypothetical protein OIF32_12570 [Campylobacterales bacterium]|nr:hypothetical protein [Campylobacterales bacterium]
MKYFIFTLQAKVLQKEIKDIQKEEEILDIITQDGITISPYLKFTPKNLDIPEFDCNDLVEGYFADRFETVRSNVVEKDENYLFEVEFSFTFNENDPVYLKDLDLIYLADKEYKYTLQGSFTKAFEPSFLNEVDTNIEILSLEAKQERRS